MSFLDFLNNISSKPLRVINDAINNSDYVPLDLSENNLELNEIDVFSSFKLENYITNHIKNNNGLVAFGGYLETRNIYRRSNHFNNQNQDTERNIHLGIDIWWDAETPIFTPLDATLHSFKNNTNFGDYGPTIILKHHIENHFFYTLYGHLSLMSLEGLEIGESFKKGDQIATLGDAKINGDYPPHLHFQLIKDIQDYIGDYPGVCSKSDLEFYKSNSPDPNLLLKL